MADPNSDNNPQDSSQTLIAEQQAMKEKQKEVVNQRQGRSGNEEPHGKMDEHPQRRQG